jgi:hypothetical protein
LRTKENLKKIELDYRVLAYDGRRMCVCRWEWAGASGMEKVKVRQQLSHHAISGGDPSVAGAGRIGKWKEPSQIQEEE